MTARELIKALGKFPPETRVVVAGYEAGYNDISKIDEIRLQPDANAEWWYGQHDKAEDDAGEPAVYLTGENQLAEEKD
jgi:hypothetical protein